MKKQRSTKNIKTHTDQKTKKIKRQNTVKKTKFKSMSPPKSEQHLPASQKQLYLVREELVEKISSVEHNLKSEIHKTNANVERLLALTEEQNNRNKITLDYLASLFERQERVEVKLEACLNAKTNKDL